MDFITRKNLMQGFVKELDARIQAWRNAMNDVPNRLHWDRAMAGQCDAFALMLADHLQLEGIINSFAIITRSTTDENGFVDVNHFSHAVVIAEDALGHQFDFDAMGSNAIDRFMVNWIDEPGCETTFNEVHFFNSHEFLNYLRSPIPNYGLPKSNATDDGMLKAWRSAWASQSISQSITQSINGAPTTGRVLPIRNRH